MEVVHHDHVCYQFLKWGISCSSSLFYFSLYNVFFQFSFSLVGSCITLLFGIISSTFMSSSSCSLCACVCFFVFVLHNFYLLHSSFSLSLPVICCTTHPFHLSHLNKICFSWISCIPCLETALLLHLYFQHEPWPWEILVIFSCYQFQPCWL